MSLIPLDTAEIRVAIVGLGKMGTYHLTGLRRLIAGEFESYYKGGVEEQLKKLKICGICDPRDSVLASITDVATFASLDELIKHAAPHIVIIASPTATHTPLAKLSLSHGIHTFVEKPITQTLAQFDELTALARQHDCRIMAGHIERYNPVAVKLVSLLKNADPMVQSYAFERIGHHDPRIADDIITDKLVHDLDLALYLFGSISHVELIHVEKRNDQAYEARVAIEHVSGVQGSIYVSWLVDENIKVRHVEIIQGGHKWIGDFVQKRLSVDGLEIKCQVDGMIKPANNQIKDELVDFISYSSQLAKNDRQNLASLHKGKYDVGHLLSLQEIREGIMHIEEACKAASMK